MLILPMLFGAFRPPCPRLAGQPRSTLEPRSRYEDMRTAIAREKQLKGWWRAKKLSLIRTIHPEFKDLAQTWDGG
jgi:predicted GIY-YIG superfamily endonuclease